MKKPKLSPHEWSIIKDMKDEDFAIEFLMEYKRVLRKLAKSLKRNRRVT